MLNFWHMARLFVDDGRRPGEFPMLLILMESG